MSTSLTSPPDLATLISSVPCRRGQISQRILADLSQPEPLKELLRHRAEGRVVAPLVAALSERYQCSKRTIHLVLEEIYRAHSFPVSVFGTTKHPDDLAARNSGRAIERHTILPFIPSASSAPVTPPASAAAPEPPPPSATTPTESDPLAGAASSTVKALYDLLVEQYANILEEIDKNPVETIAARYAPDHQRLFAAIIRKEIPLPT